MDKATKNQLLRGQKLTEVLKQPQYQPLNVAQQISILFAANEDFWMMLITKMFLSSKEMWFDYYSANMPELIAKLNDGGGLTDEDKEALKNAILKFKG